MKRIISIFIIIASMIFSFSLEAQKKTSGSKTGKTSDKTFVINTTDICSDIRGYNGPVPLEIKVVNGKIAGIRPLPNRESPGYFRRLIDADFFNRWNGLTLKQASEKEVDACTGATYSSHAVTETVKKAAKSRLK